MRTLFSRSFFPVLLAYFIDNFGLAIVYPIFTPLFLNPNLHLLGADFSLFHRTFLLGLLIASFPFAQFLGAPLIGEFSDRLGRKKVFIATITGGVIGYLMTGLGIHLKDIFLLWSGRVIAGFFAGNLTLCLASIADITEDKKMRARHFGFVGTIGGVGFILAILTGSSLSNPNLARFFHPEVPFLLTGLLALINLALMILFFRENKVKKPRNPFAFRTSLRNIGNALHQKGVRIFYFAYFLFMLCWFTSLQFLSTYLIDMFHVKANAITLTFVSIGGVWAVANFLLNPLLAKIWKPQSTFMLCLLFLGFFLFLSLLPHVYLGIYLFHFLFATLFAALCWTNGLATLSIETTETKQGSILGVNQSLAAVAMVIGPITGGFLAGVDIHLLYLYTGSASLLAAFFLFFRQFGIRSS